MGVRDDLRSEPLSGHPSQGDAVARKALPIGPFSLSLIEEAPIDLVLRVLSLRDDGNEPEFGLPATSADRQDVDQRQEIIAALAEFDQEDLRPLEHRCRRIHRLAEGKGISSLNTITEQRLAEKQQTEYSNQLDELCRSIWTYINAKPVFEDAESFYFARQFRDYGRLYDAFEVDLEKHLAIDAASIDEPALAGRITEVLELKTKCTVRALNLPPTAAHPRSIMLIVRHGGPLSSVFDHRDDGRRATIYFRPPNEATLIYTPATQQIEICADSPVVRQKISRCFAEVALGHDVSQKPLSSKHYDLSRFRSSLALPLPNVNGVDLLAAKVLEIELRLGNWKRKLSLRVTIDDEIHEVASRYLGSNNIVRRADGFSRLSIAVRYHQTGDSRERTLNITVSGSKGCNLQSTKDPEQRSLGYALLDAWGIMSSFKQIETAELRHMFPSLVQLFDRAEEEITGRFLRETGLDPARLIEGGLLERRGRQEIVLVDEDGDADGEVYVEPSTTPGMVSTKGSFGQDLGERPAAEMEVYQLNLQWLHESLMGLIKPLLSTRATQILDADLTLLGAMQIDGGNVPVYFARRLDDPKTINKLDLLLRGRSNSGFGIVLAASSELPSCLGPNVVVSLLSHLSGEDEEPVLSRTGIEFAFRSGRSLAMGGSTPTIHRYGAQSATLYVPGKAPLSLVGENQIALFERLVAAHLAGSPDVKASTLTEGAESRSPQHCFRPDMWKSILGVYITKGVRHGYWRLAV
jgi:hypothetical protein